MAAVASNTSAFPLNKRDKFSDDNTTGTASAGAAAVAMAPPTKVPVTVKGGASDSGNPTYSSSKAAETKVIPIAKEDIESILKIRKKVKKPPIPLDLTLRSQPDMVARPDENVLAIRRMNIKASGDKRKIYFSSQ